MRNNGIRNFSTGLGAAALALSLGFSATVSAQQAEPQQPPTQMPQSQQSQQSAPSQRAVDSAKQADEAVNKLAAQGKQLVGKDIYGSNNEKIGSIKDVVMGTDGKVSAVLTDIGGFLGVGSKTVAIPLEQLRAEGDDKIIASGITKQQAEALPDYEERNQQQKQQQQQSR